MNVIFVGVFSVDTFITGEFKRVITKPDLLVGFAHQVHLHAAVIDVVSGIMVEASGIKLCV